MNKEDKTRNPKIKGNYAFIDSQNLNLGVRSQGWNLDFKKFRIYLKNKYDVRKAYLFIGHIPANADLYKNLKDMGFELVMKPTTKYVVNGITTYKGNVDAELVLYAAAKVYDSYNKAIIVSGDGDFHCLAEYLNENGKLERILTPNRKYSKLLKEFASCIVRLDLLRQKLEYKKDQHWRSVETLGLSGHGDPSSIIQNVGKNSNSKDNISKKKNPLKDETLKGKSSIGDDKSIAKNGRKSKKQGNL
jgi:uncharacterized LabA/DUF88 family protein